MDMNSTIELLHERGICVVIPTYNNCGTLANVIDRTLAMCADVIVVNDGSTDDTAMILSGYEDRITVVSFERNAGKGSALKAGFRKAIEMGYVYAITLDADGQHFPEDIPVLQKANMENPGALIVGQRQGLESIERSAGSKFANSFSNFWFCVQTFQYLSDTQTGYRLYPLRKLHGLCMLTSRYEAELELLVFSSWHGVRLVSVPVNVYYPPMEERVSHFRPGKDFARISILNTILCFLTIVYALPLKIIRTALTAWSTLFSLFFFLVCTIVVMPIFAAAATLFCKGHESRTRAMHLLLNRLSRLALCLMPGVRNSIINTDAEDFSRPAVITCNHQSHLDLMLMLSLTPKLIVLTNDWVWKAPLYGYFIRMAEFYPVSMGYEELLPRLRNLVSRGYSIAVYPEGTRSVTGRIGRFHKGAFELAEALDIDILPMTLYGADMVLPKGGKYMRRGQICMEIGQRYTLPQQKALGSMLERASFFRKLAQKRIVNIARNMLVALMLLVSLDSHAQRITEYLADGDNNPAVIVCPGGSYFWHDMKTEGHLVAEWLRSNGISAFVLDYRAGGVPSFIMHWRWGRAGSQYPDAQNDLQHAIIHVKDHAAELGIDTTKVGAMGFSAGGHLVMSVAEIYDSGRSRPAFVAPIYPVVTMTADCVHKRSRRGLLGDTRKYSKALREKLSLERNVPHNCPPVFLVNCVDDPVVDYRNSVLLAEALKEKNITHKYLQYQTGGHGFGASDTKGTEECRQWKAEFLRWLEEIGIL